MKKLALLLVLFSTCAYAGEPIDFGQKLLDLNGNEMRVGKDDPALDLRTVCEIALLSEVPKQDRTPVSPKDKRDRFVLALKIHGKEPVALSSEQITLLKTAIADIYGPLIVGRTEEILDPVK